VVLARSPVSELTKEPEPDPLLVELFARVGFGVVLQQTPRWLMLTPPLFVTFPPLTALLWEMELAVVVDTVGSEPLKFVVVKLKTSPYAVPILLVAKALA